MRSDWMPALYGAALLAAPICVLFAAGAHATQATGAADTTLGARLVGDFIDIPAGRFRMGEAAQDGEADERPVHVVHIKALRVGRTEVTRGQFAYFVHATGYQTDAERGAGGLQGCYAMELSSGKWSQRRDYSWREPGFAQSDSYPVVCVSWNDIQAYIHWLNSQTGKRFRLLSESEWEYAARAGSVTRYPWGMDANQGCAHINGADNSPRPKGGGGSWIDKMECSDGFFYPAPAGSFPPNEWGLQDVVGNVWEWTSDCYHDSYEGAPDDGSAWTSGDCARHVIRGGSWADRPKNLRVSNRFRGIATLRNDNLGFRLVQEK